MSKSDKFILQLFYVYAFIISFENILEVLWEIKTPYKPFRLLALFIGVLILISRRFSSIRFDSNDLKLVGVYLFGLVPTTIAFINGRLNTDYFWSTSLQYFIALWILLLIKNIPFGMQHLQKLLFIFCAGALVNAVYMIYTFSYVDIGRQKGFMDDSNIAALSCCVAFSYFFYQFIRSSKPMWNAERMSSGIISVILILALFVAGSRTAIISMILIILFILYYQVPASKKIWHTVLLFIAAFCIFKSSLNLSFFEAMPAWNRLIYLEGKEDSRISLWKYGFEAFKESNYIGLGIEQFKNPVNYTKFVKVSENAVVINQKGLVVHNTFLTVLYEYGIISFLLLIGFFISLYNRLVSACKIIDHPVVYKLIYFNVIWFSFFLSSFQSHTMWFLYIFLGLAVSRYMDIEERGITRNP